MSECCDLEMKKKLVGETVWSKKLKGVATFENSTKLHLGTFRPKKKNPK